MTSSITAALSAPSPPFGRPKTYLDHLLAHLSPLGWEHVNLTGDYIWAAAREMSENIDGLRPFRAVPDRYLTAA